MVYFADKARAEEVYNKANIKVRMGLFEDALSLYDQAIAFDASNPMYFNNRAAALKRLSRFEDAINQYEQIVQDFPEYGKAFLSIGSTSIEMGNYEGAVSAYQRFYSAYKNGQFTFNPILGGIDQTVYGQDPLETALLTSINYLSRDQKALAIKAIRQAYLVFGLLERHYESKSNEDNPVQEVDQKPLSNPSHETPESSYGPSVVPKQYSQDIVRNPISGTGTNSQTDPSSHNISQLSKRAIPILEIILSPIIDILFLH